MAIRELAALLLLRLAAGKCLPPAALEQIGLGAGVAEAPGPVAACAVFHNATSSCVNAEVFDRGLARLEKEAGRVYAENLHALSIQGSMLAGRVEGLVGGQAQPSAAVAALEQLGARLEARTALVAQNATCLRFQLDLARNATCQLVSAFGDRHLRAVGDAYEVLVRPQVAEAAMEHCLRDIELVCDLTRLAYLLAAMGEGAGPDAELAEVCGQADALAHAAPASAHRALIAARLFEKLFAPTRALLLNAIARRPPGFAYRLHPTGMNLHRPPPAKETLL